MMGRKRFPLAERLAAKWEPCLITGCWLWVDAPTPDGYGRIFLNGRSQAAHRVSYELHTGTIPAGLQVCHRCDTPACVNPAHLFLGTVEDNMRDMKSKGRAQRGSRRANAVLTETIVADLRARKAAGERVRPRTESRRLGISECLISQILSGRGWEHVSQDTT